MATKTPAADSPRARKKPASPARAKKATKPTRPAKKSAASTRSRKAAPPPNPTPAPLQGDVAGARNWPGAQVRRGLGVALLGLAGAGRFAAGESRVVAAPGGELPAEPLVDVALGVLDLVLEAGERIAGSLQRRLDPPLRAALDMPAAPLTGAAGLGLRLLGRATAPLAERGRRLRADSEAEAAAAVATLMPETIELVMEQVDLTELAVANVDIQRVLDETVAQVDLTGFALQHMDLARLIQASVDSIDFTGLAIDKLDFQRAMTAAMEQVDILAVAREQVDPTRVAAFLRENVDLADTIRSAPSAVAGEAVRGVRETMERIVTNRRT